MSNSAVADNGGNGISISPMGSSAVVNVVLNRVEAYNNSFNGVFVGGTSTAMINAVVRESVAANSGVGGGFRVDSAGAATGLMVIRSLVANNNWGFLALNYNGTIQVSESTVTGNTTSWSIGTGAVLQSYADNNINGNADGDPAPTIVAKK